MRLTRSNAKCLECGDLKALHTTAGFVEGGVITAFEEGGRPLRHPGRKVEDEASGEASVVCASNTEQLSDRRNGGQEIISVTKRGGAQLHAEVLKKDQEIELRGDH